MGDVPYGETTNNPAYGFNKQAGLGEYKAMPYMPQIMALIRPKITEVLQTELQRNDQIKSAIVALYRYSVTKRNPDGTRETSIVDKHHRGEMQALLQEADIDEHITRTAGEIDKHIEDTLKRDLDMFLN